MSEPRSQRTTAGPPEAETSAALVEVEETLERYRQTTDVRPKSDLVDQIRHRIAGEPASTAPRRFLAALRALDGRGLWRGFRQSLGAAFSPQTRSLLLRMQAMAVVLVVIASVSLGSVAAIAAASQVITEIREPKAVDGDRTPRPTRSLTPTVAPTRPATPSEADVGTDSPKEASGGQGDAGSEAEPVADVTAGEDGPNGKADGAPYGKANAKAKSAPNGKGSEKARSAPNGKTNGAPNVKGTDKEKSAPKGKGSNKARNAPSGKSSTMAPGDPVSNASGDSESASTGDAKRGRAAADNQVGRQAAGSSRRAKDR